MKKSWQWIGLLAVVGVAAWLGWRQYERHWLGEPIAALRAPVTFEVEQGASLRATAQALGKQGLLDRPWIWIRHANRTGDATRIRAGEYRLMPGTTPAAMLAQFVAGDVLLHQLTLPEGWTVRQCLAAIQAHPKIAIELEGISVDELMPRLGFNLRHAEGQFFPDTYRFPRGTSDRDILRQAHQRMRTELAAAWQRRESGLPLLSSYEALILASLVEKETGAAEERPLIAGVFVNRLRRGMRLQTDPSVIYGLGKRFDGNLRRRDLVSDTPYNTYTRAGLPPTPVALPGREALAAAVQPAETRALYFVATGLGDGRHFFAETLAAHNQNVAKHIANLRRARGAQAR
jgi:UPF0755 protein